MNVEIPDDLVAYVASAINRRAEWCRKDTGHAPDDVIALRRDADRLDEIADRMESELEPSTPGVIKLSELTVMMSPDDAGVLIEIAQAALRWRAAMPDEVDYREQDAACNALQAALRKVQP